MSRQDNWLALVIGNSRMHWAWFEHLTLVATWDTRHLLNKVKSDRLPELFLFNKLIEQRLIDLPIWLASVVSQQIEIWQSYHKLNIISLADVDLTNTYLTMGIDRALAASGAIALFQQPCLVIDGGTALTFTGVNREKQFIGGAILPGLRSQLLTLHRQTSALPAIELPQTLPNRWAFNTDEAIASGIIYTAIASVRDYINDWLKQFPQSKIIFTGGDGELLSHYLHSICPDLARLTIIDRDLAFWGMRLLYEGKLTQKN